MGIGRTSEYSSNLVCTVTQWITRILGSAGEIVRTTESVNRPIFVRDTLNKIQLKLVSMIRKKQVRVQRLFCNKAYQKLYFMAIRIAHHNHKLQTNPRHLEEEPHNHHKTPGRQTKQSNQLSLSHRNDCKTRMDKVTHNKTITESHNGSNNQQRINNNRTTALERTLAKATRGGLNAFYWYQIFALDSAVA